MSKSYVVKGTAQTYNRNAIVDEKGVLAKIDDWKFSDKDDQTIVLSLAIKTGSKKGMTRNDFVTFDPNSNMNWKYGALREAIGYPIQPEDEYDLAELIGKYLIIDLVPSKNGAYQNVNYHKYNENLIDNLVGNLEPEDEPKKSTPTATADTSPVVEVGDDDLPF